MLGGTIRLLPFYTSLDNALNLPWLGVSSAGIGGFPAREVVFAGLSAEFGLFPAREVVFAGLSAEFSLFPAREVVFAGLSAEFGLFPAREVLRKRPVAPPSLLIQVYARRHHPFASATSPQKKFAGNKKILTFAVHYEITRLLMELERW